MQNSLQRVLPTSPAIIDFKKIIGVRHVILTEGKNP
jgi:hypothetical protein